MPLTKFQNELAKLLAQNRSSDSYLAGGAALHFEPKSERFSNDLDYFHDSIERVASAFEADKKLLESKNYAIEIDLKQPGYIRAQVIKGKHSTKIEWAHDSAWRFMPTVFNPESGYTLHPIDLAINKVLALAGREEPRDFLDVLFINRTILPLGALCWAASAKDPGFTPLSLLELIKRRGKYRVEDFERLKLSKKIDLIELKKEWLLALQNAEDLINSLNPKEVGCLYYSKKYQKFIAPTELDRADAVKHYGTPGGVQPNLG